MEPVVIFNAYGEVRKPNTKKIEYEIKRHMHLSWVWQRQQSKLIPSEIGQTINRVYCRTVALRRQGKLVMEKNWTPLFSFHEREKYGYDKYMYIVYRFNLEILKCPLEDINEGRSNCASVYKSGKSATVGPFRGGTPLVNIKHLLNSYIEQYPGLKSILHDIPAEREIWIGFARAHLKQCGCGDSMYRPNIVMLVKNNDQFIVSQVSPYMSLNMSMIPWNPSKPTSLCTGRNVMIPNGISQWMIDQDRFGNFEDYLTLTISRGDVTVDSLHIRGLLFQLLQIIIKYFLVKIWILEIT